MEKKKLQMLGVIAILLLFAGGGSIITFTVNDLGYSSAFEGPKTSFIGAEYGGEKYTTYPNRFDKTLDFDADDANGGKPDVAGEMTNVFVPEDSLQYSNWKQFPEWGDWLSDNARLTNPAKTYSWNITVDKNTTKVYRMEQWVMKFYVALSCEWQDKEDLYPGTIGEMDFGKQASNYYSNLDIWIEFDVTPTWYIEGQGTAHFCIASVQLGQTVKYQGRDLDGKTVSASSLVSVYPELSSSALYLYYNKFGTSDQVVVNEQTFQGKKLNPTYFVNKVYAHLDLKNFGVRGWNDGGAVKHQGDVATFDFDVRVFVIGEWTVKDIQQPPIDYVPLVPKTDNLGLSDYLADPRIQGLISLLVLGGLFIGLLIFAPWVLFALVGLFRSGKRK